MCDAQNAIDHTVGWIESFIIRHNICPFARKEMRDKSVRMHVSNAMEAADALVDIHHEFTLLDDDPKIPTSLLIFTHGFANFTQYLDMLHSAERLLGRLNYEGIYQLASFHPQYCFAGVPENDPANYSNRSPFPMLHFLREDALEKMIARYGDTGQIPKNNIRFLRNMGSAEIEKILQGVKEEYKPGKSS